MEPQVTIIDRAIDSLLDRYPVIQEARQALSLVLPDNDPEGYVCQQCHCHFGIDPYESERPMCSKTCEQMWLAEWIGDDVLAAARGEAVGP